MYPKGKSTIKLIENPAQADSFWKAAIIFIFYNQFLLQV
jgi:hypothetical protein